MESEAQKGDNPLDLKAFLDAQIDIEKSWRGRGTDWFLQQLASWANSMNIEFGITLNTPSGVVSGTMISHQKYFSAFADNFAGEWAGQSKEKLRELIAGYGEPLPEEEESADPFINYIHLKDAQIYAPGQNPMPSTGILWRGKISAVSGFNLGRLESS